MKRMVTIYRVFAAACLLALSWAGGESAMAASGNAHFEILAAGVQSGPGMLAWSPDGRRLAYLTKDVMLYDMKTGKSAVLKYPSPYFVTWTEKGELLALYGPADERTISVVNMKSWRAKTFTVHVSPEGVYRGYSPDELLLTAVSSDSGTSNVSYKMYSMNLSSGKLEKLFELKREDLSGGASSGGMSGWMQGGLHPFWHAAVLLEHVAPPDHEPYTRLSAVFPDTAAHEEVYQAPQGGFLDSGSFPPFGQALALVTWEGRLRIIFPGGQTVSVDDRIKGVHPAWSPSGEWIFFGGWLLHPDGKDRVRLLDHAVRASAAWSPDGRHLAVSSGGRLRLFETGKFARKSPPGGKFVDEFRGKVRLLRNLVAGGYLNNLEFVDRYLNLYQRYGFQN